MDHWRASETNPSRAQTESSGRLSPARRRRRPGGGDAAPAGAAAAAMRFPESTAPLESPLMASDARATR